VGYLGVPLIRPAVRPRWVAVALVAGAVLWVLGLSQALELRSGKPPLREFMALYTVGHVLNTSPESLYQPASFHRTYHELFPSVPANLSPLYAHAPFEAVVFRPFALVSFERALVAWQVLSLALICAGVTLLWAGRSRPPGHYLVMALLVAVSFMPVSVACISRGQVGALAFVWMAVAIWCQRRGREFCSGLTLAVCLCKPTLLVLLLPMLVVGWRVRTLIGFIGGAGVLGMVSLVVVGWQGCLEYALMVLHFGTIAAAGGRSFAMLAEHVDLNTFLSMMGVGVVATLTVLAVATAAVLPCLGRLWRNAHMGGEEGVSLAWASTLTWTMILNLYAVVYDTTVIVLGVLLMGDALRRVYRGQVPSAVQALFVLLYVVPWIPPVPMGGSRMLQLYTPALIALGVYQIWLAMRSDCDTASDGSASASVTMEPGMDGRGSTLA